MSLKVNRLVELRSETFVEISSLRWGRYKCPDEEFNEWWAGSVNAKHVDSS
jgi:hypothetical protein